MSQVVVELGERTYSVAIESGLYQDSSALLNTIDGKHVCLISCESVFELYGDQIKAYLADKQLVTVVLPDGEATKSLSSLEQIMSTLLENSMPRSTILIALGGGVIGDLTGFAASVYMRGVPFIQLPTTLLAQVDSSVGGKTAVNHPLGKNMIGAFYQPKSVLIDVDVLSTLPDREFSAGMAEVIKYGLIADRDFFEYLEANIHRILAREQDALIHIIERSVQIKADVVAEDERESGVRAILNFGHTMGHAIEAVTNYDRFLHGEAVAIGMCYALEKSIRHFGLEPSWQDRLEKLLMVCELPIDVPADLSEDALREAIMRDKKNTHGKTRWVMLDEIGHAVTVVHH